MRTEDAATAAAGWVGSDWRGGTLLVGINPGGGGDNYRRNPTDDNLYHALRAFKAAETLEDRQAAVLRASFLWMRIQQTHNIWRVITRSSKRPASNLKKSRS